MCASNESLASMGRYGDTELAHVTPHEKALLKSLGGAGTTNPRTGLKEYYSPPPEKPRTYSPVLKPVAPPPKKPYKPPPGYNQYGQWMGKGYIHEEQGVKPPKTTVAKPPSKKAPTFNEANQEAIIKKLNEKFPTKTGMEYVFKYNPNTDGFDQFVKAFGKEYTPAEFNNKFGAIMQANVADLSGGGNLFSNIVDSIKGAVNQLPDIKIDPTDLTETITDITTGIQKKTDLISDVVSDVTPDIKITDTSTGDIVKQIDKVYQGSDIDTTLEGVQEAGELMWDVVDSIISGEAKGGVKDAKDDLGDFKDKGDKAVEHIKETATNLLDPNNPNSLINTTVADTNKITQQIAHNISRDFTRKMAKQGLMTLDSNYDPSLDDPYLMTRRGRRRRGREKDVRQGALRIPTTGIGLNIPA
tara:strand:+ start:14769 stop:16010 length:1242 start_codon:yes stop_codon:yes gene_type:complete